MTMMLGNTSYVLITAANSLLARALALHLAQNGHNLLLIDQPYAGLTDWAHQLMTYGVEVDFFETDQANQYNMAILSDWIRRSYEVSDFLNLAQIAWMEELFEHKQGLQIEKLLC